MLSIQYNPPSYNAYHPLMTTDDYSEPRKKAFKYVKSPTELISIDKVLRHDSASSSSKHEESADEDEISVGCPSPAPAKFDDEDTAVTRTSTPVSPTLVARSTSSSPPPPPPPASSPVHDEKSCDPSSDADSRAYSSDDELANEPEEYFKPLKRLKMMKIDKTSYSISERSKSSSLKRLYRHNNHKVSNMISETGANADECIQTPPGVKSFSICDILSHKPNKSAPSSSSSKIVRPWDCEPQEDTLTHPYLLPPPAHRGILPQPPLFLSQFHPQQIALHLRGVKSEDLSSAYETCSSSERSSTAGSDCCTSPDVLNCSVQNQSMGNQHQHQHQHPSHRPRNIEHNSRSKNGGKNSNSSPLDALFNLTTKTFDELNGDSNTENGSHLNLFNNRQQPKKKRKSRTAFTNTQIFELERRFIYQKYLSPADRDEIAGKLGLSNAQVITWFQNRRAKLKRDLEEQKKDVESTKILSVHNTFLESVQNYGMLKKKTASHSECKHESEK